MHLRSPYTSVNKEKVAVEITDLLSSAESQYDENVRTEAEARLRELREQDLSGFLFSLSLELSNDDKDMPSRMLAGIVLKNSLDAKDATTEAPFSHRWMSFDVSLRSQIKGSLLNTLGSSVSRIAAQIIAKIASIELPKKEQPSLIASLLDNMKVNQDTSTSLKQATLEALGYVCEEISHSDLLQAEVISVLTVVLQGMNVTEQPSVRLAATRALNNILAFAQTNSGIKLEMNHIMNIVCETAIAAEADIRQAAFECLVSIASTYYDVFESYMHTLCSLTTNAVKGDEKGVALQAIELLCSICHEEIKRKEDSMDGSYCLFDNTLLSLVPMLLETLLKQDEDHVQKDDTFNLAVAGLGCLGLVVETVGDAVIPFVKHCVLENISKPDWRSREASMYACVLYLIGVSGEKGDSDSDLECLLNHMMDQNRHWTLSCIVDVLLEHIEGSPLVAEKICEFIGYLAQGYGRSETSTSVLAPHLSNIVTSLVFTAENTDASDEKLRSAAYKALKEVVGCFNLVESSEIIASLLFNVIRKLVGAVDLRILFKQGDLYALLCGAMSVLFQKLGSSDETKGILFKNEDRIMMLLLKVFDLGNSIAREQAMLAIGAFASALGPQFLSFMPLFYKYLKRGLEDLKDYKVCSVCVRVVGDICHALDYKVLPFCADIMPLLLKDLCSWDLPQSVKPPIFSCLGDMALATGIHFEDYAFYVVPLIVRECEKFYVTGGEYENQLKRSIFQACSGILQGCKRSKADFMGVLVSCLLKFRQDAVKDPNWDKSVVRAAVAVLGDLALGPNAKIIIKDLALCREFSVQCLQSEDEQLKETATRTLEIIDKMSSICRTQDEDQDQKEDVPNLAVAGGTVARTVSKPDWLSCAGATWSYLESVSVEEVSEMFVFDLESLLNAMSDNRHVKDDVAWTLSCILKLLQTPATGLPVILPKLKQIMAVLLASIKDSPDVAEKVCGVIYYLAQETSSSALAPYLQDIISSLIATAERTHASDAKLRSAAYETLQEVVRCCNLVESSQIITPYLPFFLNKFAQIKFLLLSSDDTEKQEDLQALVCGVMRVIIQKFSSTDKTKFLISERAYQIMMLLLEVFDLGSSIAREKAMLAIGALARATGPEFWKYMPKFFKALEMGLGNSEEYKVCAISVGVVSDVCHALDYKVIAFCADIMGLLVGNLYTDDLHRSVKPPTFSCFGDMALAIGIYFEDYVSYVVPLMQKAADEYAQIDVNDEEMVQYANQLKQSIFQAYSGILQGCKRSKAEIMEPYVPHLLKFIKVVVKEANRDKSVVRAAVAVLGDLALGPNAKMIIEHLEFCRGFLVQCLQSEDEQLKETATRTREIIDKISSICG